uniref:Uncharacterized protein n=1 Tax=Arundo donax TaxID=35708 RepID=A0A0A8Z7L6_ARUDO
MVRQPTGRRLHKDICPQPHVRHCKGGRTHSSGVQAQGVPGHAGSLDISCRPALMNLEACQNHQ